ncbi:MAG: DnaB-like helicase C-terminal domain-containing protein [Syntrophothermus sp.]
MKAIEIKKRLENELIGICLTDFSYSEEILSKLIFEELENDNRSVFLHLSKTDFSTLDSQCHLRQKLNDSGITISVWLKAAAMLCPHDELVSEKLMAYYDSVMALRTRRILSAGMQRLCSDFRGLDIALEVMGQLEQTAGVSEMFRQEVSLYEEYDAMFKSIIRERNDPSSNTAVKSASFQSFNDLTGGIKPGNIVTIAGAYKQGKTTFGLQLMLDFALNSGINIGIFSLEMTHEELMKKMLGIRSGVSSRRLREPVELEDLDVQKLAHTKDAFRSGQIYICDNVFTEAQIKAKAHSWIRKYGVKVILIDYIGLVELSVKNRKEISREREMAYLSVYFKNMAKEIGVPVIQLAQMNRQGINDPKSSNLADTIAIARDSDFLFTICRPSEQGKDSMPVNGTQVPVKDNYFLVTLCNSRHTKSGGSFLLYIADSGELHELNCGYH